jgi:hypothetical protein
MASVRRGTVARTLVVSSLCVLVSAAFHTAVLRRFAPSAPRSPVVVVAEAALAHEPSADLGTLFLRSELADRPADLAPALARWTARKAAYAHIGEMASLSPHERVGRLVTELFAHDHAGAYVRDSSTLARFLDDADPGGNCEAQTKLVLGALTAAGVQLGPGESIGVQVFDDHVQAVVYDARSSRVWVPFTGEMQESPTAPIYRPEILFHAAIAGAGNEPPVPAESFLIAAPRRRGRPTASGLSTDSTLRFPPAGVRHQQGPVPERATLSAPSAARNDGDGPPDLVRMTDVESRPLTVREQAIAYERCPAIAISLLQIPDPADAALFNALPSIETRAAFLVELAERTMDSASLDTTDDLVRLVERGDMGALARRLPALHSILSTVGCTKEAVRALAIATRVYSRQPFQADDRGPLAPFAADVEALPRVASARSEVSALTAFIGRNPQRFAERLAAMPHGLRAELLTLLPHDLETYSRSILPLVAALAVAPGKPDVPDTVPPPLGGPVTWMTVELDDLVTPPPLPVENAAPPAAPPPSHEATAPGAPVRAPPDVMIDLAVFAIASRFETTVDGPPAALKKKWTRAVDAQFQARRASAPTRERTYFDAMAGLGLAGK